MLVLYFNNGLAWTHEMVFVHKTIFSNELAPFCIYIYYRISQNIIILITDRHILLFDRLLEVTGLTYGRKSTIMPLRE